MPAHSRWAAPSSAFGRADGHDLARVDAEHRAARPCRRLYARQGARVIEPPMSSRQIAVFVHPTEAECADAVETARSLRNTPLAPVLGYFWRPPRPPLWTSVLICLAMPLDERSRLEIAQHRQWSSF